MSRIELKNIDKFYGKNHVLKNLNLTIDDGDFMTLLGPSGCGKTTTLRVLSGLESPQNGFIYIDGKEIVNAKEAHYAAPSERNLNLVFQSYALWPHMTVFDNVAFGLRIKKVPDEEIKTRVKGALERMQIGEFEKRYPSELSGGQQQRVAIARAIVSEPKLLLLDEPLSNLDAKLRVDMRSELKRLHHETGTTIVYVTHDQVEALTMSTKIALFRKGELVQVSAPLDLYDNPVDLYAADFIGNPSINFVKGHAEYRNDGMTVTSDLGTWEFDRSLETENTPHSGSGEVVLGVRPEIIKISKKEKDGYIPARVYSGMPAGSETLVDVSVKDAKMTVKQLGSVHFTTDQEVFIKVNTARVNVFDKASEKLIKMAEKPEEEQ